jgi:hypothetical protein
VPFREQSFAAEKMTRRERFGGSRHLRDDSSALGVPEVFFFKS